MTEPEPDGVEMLEVQRLRLIETAAPQVPSEHRFAMDRVWDEAVRANPGSLFDGPVVACAGLEWDGPCSLVLSWTRVTYRHYALRRVPGADALPSLFVVAVQPTDDGALLVGRMSPSTAAPGRWQLPGGSLEPPDAGEHLDEAALRDQAARELAEETGSDLEPAELTLWAVTCGENGSIGVFFRVAARPEPLLRERFTALLAAEAARGRDPELEEIALVRSAAEVARLAGPQVDYLEPIVRRHSRVWLGGGTCDAL
ncbi:NUDIX domain-containing protein [Sinosporangium siamense]|uniref:DNA mismatch repair protein MutT n=1 Tax=Sinosporangium siamense TaxID=1367973 RepID=A0A919VAE7_9ACTN|nr:NUDIX domain-containing protein [Sinosporangium siamense]GII96391.1 DNA mismatch repair protein MutT [Sinosporangium siamense]